MGLQAQAQDTLIRAWREEDAAACAALLMAAFGPGRFAKTSERVREQGAQPLAHLTRVAADGGQVIGLCQISAIRIGAERALFLGPLAVHPHAQKGGIGAGLVTRCLAACRQDGAAALVLVGAPAFFAPLGFVAAPIGHVILPGPVNPERLLWAPLQDGAALPAGAVSGFPGASPP